MNFRVHDLTVRLKNQSEHRYRLSETKFRHRWRIRSRIYDHDHHSPWAATFSDFEKPLSGFLSHLASSVLTHTVSIVSMQHWKMVQNHRLICGVYSTPPWRNSAKSPYGRLALPLQHLACTAEAPRFILAYTSNRIKAIFHSPVLRRQISHVLRVPLT